MRTPTWPAWWTPPRAAPAPGRPERIPSDTTSTLLLHPMVGPRGSPRVGVAGSPAHIPPSVEAEALRPMQPHPGGAFDPPPTHGFGALDSCFPAEMSMDRKHYGDVRHVTA